MEKKRRLLDEYRFPGFVPRAEIKGIFGDSNARDIRLKRTQKNGMRVLWKDSLESIRQEGASGTGFILWRCTDLPGSGGTASIMSEVRKGEAGKTGMACGQSLYTKRFACSVGRSAGL
ncbi:MAG: hypothetical protein HS132_13190 [Planctomycetia bacterium]|nr:hypothetical protein [Planctomycetia bacterium]